MRGLSRRMYLLSLRDINVDDDSPWHTSLQEAMHQYVIAGGNFAIDELLNHGSFS
jgi:hypothetical protein